MSNKQQLSSKLAELFKAEGTPIELELNHRLFLHGEDHVLWLESGNVDIFSFEPLRAYVDVLKEHLPEKLFKPFSGDILVGSINYLRNVKPHSLLFLFEAKFKVAKPLMVTIANECSQFRLMKLVDLQRFLTSDPEVHPEVDKQVLDWVQGFEHLFQYRSIPKLSETLEGGTSFVLSPNQTLSLSRIHDPDVIRKLDWINIKEGAVYVDGMQTLYLTADDYYYPIAQSTWVTSDLKSVVEDIRVEHILSDPKCLQGLKLYHHHVLEVLFFSKLARNDQEKNIIREQEAIDKSNLLKSFSELGGIFDKTKEQVKSSLAGKNLIFQACQKVGDNISIKFLMPPKNELKTHKSVEALVYELCLYSHINYRKVRLGKKWWEQESPPMLGFYGEESLPIALIHRENGGYDYFLPETNKQDLFEPELFPDLQMETYVFYRPFPPKESLTGKEVFYYGIQKHWFDLLIVLLIGFLTTIVSFLGPISNQVLFDVAIPYLDYVVLAQAAVGLFVAAISALIFNYTIEYALGRFQSTVDHNIETALWQRVLTLSTQFFRRFTVGDLIFRMQAISTIRKTLSGQALRSIINALLSVLFLIPMIFYSWQLSLSGLGLLVFQIVLSGFILYMMLQLYQERAEWAGINNGKLLQSLQGITKIRTYGCESRMFADWGSGFYRMKELDWRICRYQNFSTALNSLFPVLSLFVIYGIVIFEKLKGSGAGGLSVGEFMGFNAAFGAFSFAILGASNTLIQMISLVPLWNRSKVIFQTPPEISLNKLRLEEISGAFKISHLYFSYDKDSPYILEDFNLNVEAGQFVGIVGYSGCGKSTLLRLLIGFETPEKGAIHYDGKDLSMVDLQGLRSQVGIVLQNGSILDGSIRENIMSGGIYSDDQIKHALDLAGFKEDLELMPMGLDTFLSNGGATLSGGQKQRLLIARSLIGDPKILFFDEATSALDNQTQDIINRNLEQLNKTRIVIAHRLSTIRKADRIYVMDKGSIIQSGTFLELASQKGMFADLLKKQKQE